MTLLLSQTSRHTENTSRCQATLSVAPALLAVEPRDVLLSYFPTSQLPHVHSPNQTHSHGCKRIERRTQFAQFSQRQKASTQTHAHRESYSVCKRIKTQRHALRTQTPRNEATLQTFARRQNLTYFVAGPQRYSSSNTHAQKSMQRETGHRSLRCYAMFALPRIPNPLVVRNEFANTHTHRRP